MLRLNDLHLAVQRLESLAVEVAADEHRAGNWTAADAAMQSAQLYHRNATDLGIILVSRGATMGPAPAGDLPRPTLGQRLRAALTSLREGR